MDFFTHLFLSCPLQWWITLIISAVGTAAVCLRALESDEVRAKRIERNKKQELRLLTQRICSYGRAVQQRYPTGDVIVSEADLAGQLRKPCEAVAMALNVLFVEQKVRRATLTGILEIERAGPGTKTVLSVAWSC